MLTGFGTLNRLHARPPRPNGTRPEPDTRFDIRKANGVPPGMRTLDYSSNTDDMDLYLEASGRAIEAKGDVLMPAEDLPTSASCWN